MRAYVYLKWKKKTPQAVPFVKQITPLCTCSLNAHKLFCSGKSFWIGPRALWIQGYSSRRMKSCLASLIRIRHSVLPSIILVIIGKYFLYVNALNSKFYVFNEFVSPVCDKIRLEKYISSTSSCVKEFGKKWSRFLHI